MSVKPWFYLRFLYAGALGFAAAGPLACSTGAPTGPGGAVSEDRPDRPPTVAPPAPLRRLTQEQYRRSVRDLLGVSTDGISLPIDEGVAGFFANIIAPVSELQLEQYSRAAEQIARAARGTLLAAARCDVQAQAPTALCVDRFIAGFGRRVYRRPLVEDERRSLAQLYAAEAAKADAEAGLRAVVAALLASPHFLYLVEPLEPLVGGAVARVGDFALAARLSYFLWGSAPDEALLAAAAAGGLTTRAGLAQQTTRLMADPRFVDTLASFHLQWLDLTELGGVEKRNKLYPLFTPDLRAAMREETVRFVDHVFRHEPAADAGQLDTLLKARFSIVGQGLYELYGFGARRGTHAAWQKMDFKRTRRAGLFTQAAFLSRHAHWDKPSLVLRGKVVRERLLCTDLPPPPPDVNNTPPPFDPKVSMRERFEDHRSEVSCSRCHRLIDPLGIPFEGFDAIGGARTMDGPTPVDPSSEIEGTARSNGPVKDAVDLVDKLAASDEVRDCVVLQWFRYALGRDVTAADAASLTDLRARFRASGHRVPALLAAIATTDSFRYAEASR